MRLHLLDFGSLDLDKGRVQTPGVDEGVRVRVPVPGYLIETDDGRSILIDSGVHRKHIDDPDATFGGTPIADEITVVMTAENDPRNRLAEFGLTPDDIDIVVATHFHFDHAGNHADFGRSRIVAHRKAYEFNKANFDPYTRDLWDLPYLTYDLIDDDTEIAPGVRLVETSGHAIGHLSVIVDLPNTGRVILVIDAIPLLENLETDNWQAMEDPALAKESAHRLADLSEQSGALLITGHDPVQWAQLADNRSLD